MKDAIKQEYKYWNWGGTWLTQNGVYQFKKKWGAVERIYNYSTIVNNQTIFNEEKEIFDEKYYGFYIFNFNRLHEVVDVKN